MKTICVNGKVLELPYVKTLLQNTTYDESFQNFKFNYVERVEITIYNNAIMWIDKVIGCVKSHFEDDSHKDIIQAVYKVLNSWTVMEETPKENTTRSGSETEHVEGNSGKRNNEKSDDDDEQSDDDGEHCDNDNKNDLNSAKNSFLFTEVDSSIDLLTNSSKNPLLNVDVQISLLKMEYKFQDYVKQNYKTESVDFIAIWRSIFRSETVGVTDYSSILKSTFIQDYLSQPCTEGTILDKRLETNSQN